MAVSGNRPTFPLVEITLEFLKALSIAILWMALFTALLAGFGDYEPSPQFTVHASGGQR